MYVNVHTNSDEMRGKKLTPELRSHSLSPPPHHHHHCQPQQQYQQQHYTPLIDDSRYPTSSPQQHRYNAIADERSSIQHRDGPDNNCVVEQQATTSPSSSQSIIQEVTVQNPTRLFHLMNRHLWAQALQHLKVHPSDARVWVTSSSSSPSQSQRNLPLHLACLMLSSGRGEPPPPPLHFIEALVHAYPDATAESNLEGSLPLHLASESIDFTTRYLESEGILLLLSKTYPAGLTVKDNEGRVPLEILEQRGISAFLGNNKMRKSGIIRYMKSQTKTSKTTEMDERNKTDFVTPKKLQRSGVSNSSKHHSEGKSTPRRIKSHPRIRNESPSQHYPGYDLLSTPMDDNGYDLISTPTTINFHAQRLSGTPPRHSTPLRDRNVDDQKHSHQPEYVLLSPLPSFESKNVPNQSLTMSHRNVNELEVRLCEMEAKYAQLQSEFDSVTSIHSETVSELKEQTKRIEQEHQNKVNEVLNEKEKDRIRLNSELEAQKRANMELEDKLSNQFRVHSDLKDELNERTKQLNEMRSRESSLLQKLMDKLGSDNEKTTQNIEPAVTKDDESLVEKNILLREVALNAVQTVGLLQRDAELPAKTSTDHSNHVLSKLHSIELGMSPKPQHHDVHLEAKDSLQMMHPIIEDAQNMQNNITREVQKLLHLCNITASLIAVIPNIPQDDFNFEETLHALESVMNTNIDMVHSLDNLFVAGDKIMRKIALVTKQTPAEINGITPAADESDKSLSALSDVMHISKKTEKKLESLSKTVSQLNFGKVDMMMKEEEIKKYLKAADEVTKVFELSLNNLTADTKKIHGIAKTAIKTAINANRKL
ncbi:hypothetical protein ACHAWC_008127 [Mediolabrus comicus]